MNNNKDLVEVLEKLRGEKYSQIPKELIDSILTIEKESLENRTDVLKRISIEIENYLKKIEG